MDNNCESKQVLGIIYYVNKSWLMKGANIIFIHINTKRIELKRTILQGNNNMYILEIILLRN